MEIWHRFPKFVIGFLTASIIFSIYSADLGPDLGTALINKGVIDGIEKGVRTWFFVLAFTAIGLSTNFRELAPYFKGGKPLILYVCGQSFNLALTLAMAYVMFYLVFPEITAKIRVRHFRQARTRRWDRPAIPPPYSKAHRAGSFPAPLIGNASCPDALSPAM